MPYLTSEQCSEFASRGVLRFDALLPLDIVKTAREAVTRRMAALGLDAQPTPAWPEPGIRSQALGKRHPEVARLIEVPLLRALVAELLDGHAVADALFKRPQLLVTRPQNADDSAPLVWHVDMPPVKPFAADQAPGVSLFTFLDRVEPGGGGTLVLPGSHRFWRPGDKHALRRQPFVAELARMPATADARDALLRSAAMVDGAPLSVLEMTGAPGDAFLMDQRLMHSAAPNGSDRPRMMVTYRFFRADLIDSSGWD